VIGRWLRELQISGKYAIEFFEAGDDPESS
jgi:hypothetical protein